jgi:YidC/Oxa1 family membrane protein insertase
LNIWDIVILQPMINIIVALSHFLFDNYGLTIIIITIVIRSALLPLTLKQLRASKKMQDLQPKLAELQKKYAKDKQTLAQEQMKLYKESGVSASGCAVPMLIQFPIWIALYQAIILTLAISPEALLNLSNYFYSWALPMAQLPFNNNFLWLDLATGDTILAILVGASMWIQQKMVTPQNQDPRAAQQTQMMLWMMPLMFAFFSMTFPAGLALYWFVSNVISIVIQYFVTGWGGLSEMFARFKGPGSKSGGSSSSGRDKKLRQRLSSDEAKRKDSETNIVNGTGVNDSSKSSNPIKRWFGGS